jgi:putative transposase
MPKRLKRITGQGDLHFITFGCYQRRHLLGTARARNVAVEILRQVRARYKFALIGYVFMPDHVHLLIGESPGALPTKILQIFKRRLSRRMRGGWRARPGQLSLRFGEPHDALRRFWQRRYYDFNIYSRAKVLEKLHYMHANPVKGKLVKHPGEWPWSSWCFYHGRDALIEMDPRNAPSLEASIEIRHSKERQSGAEVR